MYISNIFLYGIVLGILLGNFITPLIIELMSQD